MTTRSLTLATLLMLAMGVATTPVLAQSVGGNRGPAELPPTRSAPISLPANAKPAPTPRVDGTATRDIFGLDPALALESLATVSLDRGGDIFEIPTSEGMRSAFEAAVRGSQGD